MQNVYHGACWSFWSYNLKRRAKWDICQSSGFVEIKYFLSHETSVMHGSGSTYLIVKMLEWTVLAADMKQKHNMRRIETDTENIPSLKNATST